MSVTKDTATGKWMSQLRVTDWQGKTIHKKKRGFLTKKEAQEWEFDFITQCRRAPENVGLTFAEFVKVYLADMEYRLKPSTIANKKNLIETKLIPFFGRIPLTEIRSTDIRKWQNGLTSYRDDKGKPYSPTYLKCLQNQITAIFNYAVKYYDLRENPCHKAGTMGKKNAEEMQFWTKDEFEQFIGAVTDKPMSYAIFMTLYYTGMREGELLALTPKDINFKARTISINKRYQRLGKEDVITTPKTPKSRRTITIPKILSECLQEYMSHVYELGENDRLFNCTKHYLTKEMVRGCKKSGVKKIRTHDIRHSHASLLVELGFSPKLIADRLGHEKIQTTLDTYSHLYPNKQNEVADRLDELATKNP